ncbi:hypothetical protein [Frigidibacter mobilis]|uniref:Uncharacterized protein n=1 Tax=Frigidibacter mobilis TaxID=1335048 RepID=A0A159Z6H7_9RHOB|nr:hypothetical protein [Frigidibacter mobilis]AMY70952.1 hypothetical protein AKL17_3729 [Frigidibacter mobilis]
MNIQITRTARDATEGVRAACGAAFETLADRLGDVQRGVGGLLRQTADLSALLNADSGGPDPAAAVLSAARGLIDLLGMDAPVAAGYGAAAAEARDSLSRIDGEARALGAVSSLTLITARSLNAPGLEDYIRTLRGFIEGLAADARALDAGVCAVTDSRLEARDAAALALRALNQSVIALDAGGPSAETTARETAALRTRLAAQARDAADIARRETKALIAGVQFADEFAQRLAHVEAIMDDGAPGTAALAAVQISALAEDAEAVCDVAARALDRLDALGAELRAGFGEGGGEGPVAAAVRARRAAMQAAQSREAEMVAALDKVAAAADAISASIGAAESRFAGLGRSAASIKHAAINATLLTARSGPARAALGVLAEAVHASAVVAGRQSVVCRRAIGNLSEGFDSARVAATVASAAEFRAAMATCASALDTADAALSNLTKMRDRAAEAAAVLVEAVRRCRSAVERVRATQSDLRAMAGASAPAAEREDLSTLGRFEELYTMERERAVHRLLTGSAAPPIDAPAKLSAEDAADSILF